MKRHAKLKLLALVLQAHGLESPGALAALLTAFQYGRASRRPAQQAWVGGVLALSEAIRALCEATEAHVAQQQGHGALVVAFNNGRRFEARMLRKAVSRTTKEVAKRVWAVEALPKNKGGVEK